MAVKYSEIFTMLTLLNLCLFFSFCNRFEQRDFLMTKNPNLVDFPLEGLKLNNYVVSPKRSVQELDQNYFTENVTCVIYIWTDLKFIS